MAIKLFSHGACREVTGSKHFLEVDGRILQVDCGMFQGRREEAYRKNAAFPFLPTDVSAVLLTHAHYDHSGALPILKKKGFNGNIYSTDATRDVTQIILLDSANIQQKDYEYIQEKIGKHPERGLTLYEPLYSTEEAVQTMRNFVSIDYHRPFNPIPEVTATFYDAGHILGSALVHLTTKNGMRIGFSGDLGRRGLPIIRDPETLPEMDFLVLEGTYGNRLHQSIGMGKEELVQIVQKANARGGKVIIPAFTIERTQELIYIIHTLLLDKRIPEIPIFIDSPMAVNATAIFKIHTECFDQETMEKFITPHIDPFGFDTIRYTASSLESRQINSFRGPAIIISASGMAESGRILHHLANNIENPDNIIAIVGFMADHTLGRKLVERVPEVKIFGKSYRLNAEIATLNAFSSHADYQEIIAWLLSQPITSLKKIFLVHGEEAALKNLQTELLASGIPAVEIVDSGREYRLDA